MKHLLFYFSFFIIPNCFSQTNSITVTSLGIDSLRIDMEIGKIEKILNRKLEVYALPDSIIKGDAEFLFVNECSASNPCKFYKLNYNGILMILKFPFLDNLSAIYIFPNQKNIQVNSEITTGISESRFIQICKENNFYHSKLKNKFAYFFSDNSNGIRTANLLFATFANSSLNSINVLRMIK